MDQLRTEIENGLAGLDPAIELIALERLGHENLRLYVDHPDGVGLELCERVTRHVRDLLADYAFEVSSPGIDRPLTKPQHYARFVGHQASVRLSRPIEGRRSYTGRIAAAGADSFTLESDDGSVEVPFDHVHRSNLVPELSEVPS